MEVLARYCSIPGYKKLCCESCSKRSSTLPPPFLREAAELDEDMVINVGDIPKTLATPTSSVPPRLESATERRGPLGRTPSLEEDAPARIPPSYSRARVAGPSQRRVQNQARGQPSRPVGTPDQPPTRSGHLAMQNASALFNVEPLAARGNVSSSVPSPHRTSRKSAKQVERRPPPRSSTVER